MRVVHCKYEHYNVYIGRGSNLGNLFTHLPLHKTKALVRVATVEDAVQCCRQWAHGDARWDDVIPKLMRKHFLAAVKRLKEDAILGCHCVPDHPCHGEIILEIRRELKELMS